ncbi:MAG: hypothetical protein R3F24_13655 [Gammaproteobacteria bacterium]
MFRLVVAATVLLLLSACSTPVKMASTWQPESRPAQPYSNVLVVAVSEDFDRRRLFENAVGEDLAAQGVRGTTSTRTMRTTDVLSRESVTALVRQSGADAVLVTRLVNTDVSLKEKRGQTVLKMGTPDSRLEDFNRYGYGYGYDLYMYDFTVTWEPSSLIVNRDVALTTNLFDTSNGKQVYTVRTDVKISNSASLDRNSDVAVIDKVANELVRKLRQDGAIP